MDEDHKKSEHEPWCGTHRAMSCTCRGEESTRELLDVQAQAANEKIVNGFPRQIVFNGKVLSLDEMAYLRGWFGSGESLMKKPKGAYEKMIHRLRNKIGSGERPSKSDIDRLTEAGLIELCGAPRSSHRYGAIKTLMEKYEIIPKGKKRSSDGQTVDDEDLIELRDDLPTG